MTSMKGINKEIVNLLEKIKNDGKEWKIWKQNISPHSLELEVARYFRTDTENIIKYTHYTKIRFITANYVSGIIRYELDVETGINQASNTNGYYINSKKTTITKYMSDTNLAIEELKSVIIKYVIRLGEHQLC